MFLTRLNGSRVNDKLRRLLKVVYRLGDSNEPTQLSPWGVDSNPVNGTQIVFSKTDDASTPVAFGCVGRENEAAQGETRLYCTDATGNIKATLHFKNSGDIILAFTGNVEFNGNTDNLVSYTPLSTAYAELQGKFNALVALYNAHSHAPGSPPTSPAVSSAGSVTGCKISNLKV